MLHTRDHTTCLQDNGVKIVDPLGEMLAKDWEMYASLMSNCRLVWLYSHCGSYSYAHQGVVASYSAALLKLVWVPAPSQERVRYTDLFC